MKDNTRFIDKYLNEVLDYGGEPHTRAEIIIDMQSQGIDQPCIDRWLQGYEHAQRRRERTDPFTVKLYLDANGPAS